MNQAIKHVYAAVDQGQIDRMRDLLQPIEDDLLQRDRDELLDYCLTQRRTEAVGVSVLAGADINRKAISDGRTPLSRAISQNSMEIAVMLLVQGADPQIADNLGDTPAHLAAVANAPAILAILERNGADLSQQNKLGDTPALTAVEKGSIEALSFLLENNIAGDRETLLRRAEQSMNPEIIHVIKQYAPTTRSPMPRRPGM